ncbi:MAG: DUF3794 domain-containing protein [Clostridia bacterium]|nr:DUF3794 domain-containing protein [Clostridia bacterium]
MEKEFTRTICKEAVYLDCSCEHTLPDYQGEVKKILSHQARVVPAGKFVSGGEVEYAGSVKFSVTYLDADNKLTCSEFSTDYDEKFAIDGERYIDSSVDARIASYTVRPSGPRKFSAKATLVCRPTVLEKDVLCIAGGAVSDGEVAQKLEREISVKRSMWGRGGEVEISDELGRIADVTVDDIEILAISGEVKVNEARAAVGGVIAIGTVELVAIVSTPDQPAFAIKKSFPFEQFIAIDEAQTDMSATAGGEISSTASTLNVEEDGTVSVGVSAIVEYTARVDSNYPFTVVKDAYLTTAQTENSYTDFAYEHFVANKYAPVSLSAEASLIDAGCEEAHSIVTSAHTVKITELTTHYDRVSIVGEVGFSGVACQINEDGNVGYCNYKFTSPFSESIKLDTPVPEGARVECSLSGASSSVTLDATDVFGKCEASLCISVSADFVERVLSSSEKVGDIADAPNGAVVTVCFPDDGDTLWDIAKRYHTTVRDIAVNNSLTEETVASASSQKGLRGIKKLLVM